jgi:hypothetical protein
MRHFSILITILLVLMASLPGTAALAADPVDSPVEENTPAASETPVVIAQPLLGEPENPIPLSYAYRVPNARGKLEFQVLKANYDALGQLRGPEYNLNNFPPKPGNKFILVRVRVTNKGVWGERGWVWKGDFGATTSSGKTLTPSGVYVHDRMFFELDGGAIGEGELVFEAPQSENNLLLFYAPDYLRLERTYFATK